MTPNNPSKPEPPSEARRILMGLALAENMGDVNDYLPRLCALLGEDEPEWWDEAERYIMPWEDRAEVEREIADA